jgi:hypothetical protein
MSDDRIGSYVVRERDEGPRITLAHFVESVVTDEPVTRCGRRLKRRDGTHFAYQTVPAIRICKACDG